MSLETLRPAILSDLHQSKSQPKEEARVLIYSHDTFGLGHLRRCRTLAHALVGAYKNLSVLILSGSPIIGSFDFRMRTDFVRIPGVIKLHNGDYRPLALETDITDILKLRASVIRSTAEAFQPDLFIVDKEPLGLRGEVSETLEMLKHKGAGLVLGLRDILDDDQQIKAEWQRKNVLSAVRDLYDEVWIYGVPEMGKPLDVFNLSPDVQKRISYTGYLERSVWADRVQTDPYLQEADRPFYLVTAGGGGDGLALMDWVLRTYEADKGQELIQVMMVLGPFMPAGDKADLLRRATDVPHVHMIEFDAHIEGLMQQASGVIAMGGYNTFCEILSFDKPALLVPRKVPRLEQTIRAEAAQKMGLVRMLEDNENRDISVLKPLLEKLHCQQKPSEIQVQGLLDGQKSVINLAGKWLTSAQPVEASV